MSNVHKHLLMDGIFLNPPTKPEILNDWFSRLVKAIDMEVFLEPQSKYCDIPGNEGLSGMVWLTTSHASLHFWNDIKAPFAKGDVYSCKEYDPNIVLKLLEEFK